MSSSGDTSADSAAAALQQDAPSGAVGEDSKPPGTVDGSGDGATDGSDAKPDAPGIKADADSATQASTSAPARTRKRKIKEYNMDRWRSRSGRFYCDKEDVERLASRTRWLTGDGLAVFAEEKLMDAAVPDVDIVHPAVLQAVEYWQDGKSPTTAAASRLTVIDALKKAVDPSVARKWLILAHVLVPLHWTLVEVRWDTRSLHYYDSFSVNGGYARRVERRVRGLLTLCQEVFSLETSGDDWTWHGEQRAARQSNEYDCGPFAVADLVSLLTTDAPSPKEQADMRRWRVEIHQTIAPLENVETIPKELGWTTAGQEVVEISDSD